MFNFYSCGQTKLQKCLEQYSYEPASVQILMNTSAPDSF